MEQLAFRCTHIHGHSTFSVVANKHVIYFGFHVRLQNPYMHIIDSAEQVFIKASLFLCERMLLTRWMSLCAIVCECSRAVLRCTFVFLERKTETHMCFMNRNDQQTEQRHRVRDKTYERTNLHLCDVMCLAQQR